MTDQRQLIGQKKVIGDVILLTCMRTKLYNNNDFKCVFFSNINKAVFFMFYFFLCLYIAVV